MAWIDQNDVRLHLGRITSEAFNDSDIDKAIADATALAEESLRGTISEATLKSWDTLTNTPPGIRIQVGRMAAGLILNQFQGQSLTRPSTGTSSRASDLMRAAEKRMEMYASGELRVVDPSTDDSVPLTSQFFRSGKNTSRKFPTGTDKDPKKLDRL